ncbi:MAG: arylesterase [Kordiimonadaceae bacterium]|nr:arylesterase [Kordiimonadaceae bacterium]MBO6567915.1 arylesterase [Kordiimonadaceae bacterium]MBO6964355.1 arylesterase [Kordiimonadaceae bacterium]
MKLLAAFTLVFAVGSTSFAADDANSGEPIAILAFGDSLTAGYGLPAGDGFVDQLQAWLTNELGEPVQVVNGGVSGDTSTGGRSRLDWALAPIKSGKPDLVIMELGANDALRGVAPDVTRQNMDAMLGTLNERGIPTLVAGMLASPSWGPDYEASFNGIFPDLAEKYGMPLYPFFLDGVATIPELNQADGIHPTKEGVAIIIGKIGPVVKQALSR